jgi:hypothetical protein
MSPASPYRSIAEWRLDQELLGLAWLEDYGRRLHGPEGPGDYRSDLEAVRRFDGLGELISRLRVLPAPEAEASAALQDRRTLIRARSAATSPELPLDALCRRLELTECERDLLQFLYAVQTCPEVERLARALWPETGAGTAFGFIVACLGRTPSDRVRLAPALAPAGTLRRLRLLVAPAEGPRNPTFALPEAVTTWLGGFAPPLEPPFAAMRDAAPAPAELLATEAVAGELAAATSSDGAGGARRAWLVAPPGSAPRQLVHALASACGTPLVRWDIGAFLRQRNRHLSAFEDGLRNAVLLGAWLLVEAPPVWPNDSEWFVDAACHQLSELPIPVVLLSEGTDIHTRRLVPDAQRIDARELSADDLVTLWMAISPERPAPPRPGDLRAVFSDFELRAEAVLAAAPDAARRAVGRGALQVGREDLSAACQAQLDVGFGDLATRVQTEFGWDQLIVPDSVRDQLREILLMCTERNLVMNDWGFGKLVPYGGGVTVMFSGPSGTGKTMGASIIAGQLGRPLYRVDLSRIFDRYVGETEKNLARIFEAARSGHAIVLFDEADALFSRRTEVKSSNDRYANLEVNYLLQRIEQHKGIVILTTNLDSSIDEAFRRRIRHTVRFPSPDADARELLWRSMLPKAAKVAPNLDFPSVAARFEIAGGAIKNAVLRAAFLAVGDHSPITTQHLERAALAECAALGILVRK